MISSIIIRGVMIEDNVKNKTWFKYFKNANN